MAFSLKMIKNTELEFRTFLMIEIFQYVGYSIFETFYVVKKCPIFVGFVRELNQKSVCLKGTVCQQ